jgi:uncharacterized membrane protein YfcA
MAAVIPAQQMLGMTLPILIAGDILSNLHYLRQQEWRLLRPLTVGAALGIAAGSAALWHLSQRDPEQFKRWLTLLISGICLFLVALQGYRLFGREVPKLPTHPGSSLGVGGLAGFVSTLSHSAGPLVTIYLLQERVEKRRLVGTLVLFFLIVNVLKVPTFVKLGLITTGTLRDSIWLLPLIPLGTLMGAWANRRIPEKPFAASMYAVAAVTAAILVYRSW